MAEKFTQRYAPACKPEESIPRLIRKYPPIYRTYVILGDGELHEGSNWEAAMFAGKYKLDNLIAIVDYNKWCIEGIASCRVLPNLVVLCPADAVESAKAAQAMLDYVGPVVLKTEMGPPPLTIFSNDYQFTIGEGCFVKNGKDATIISTGFMTGQAVRAIDLLEKEGLDVGILHLGTIKPLDNAAILAAAKESGAIVTAELNSVIGGLGEGVASVLSQNLPTPLRMVGGEDEFTQSGGDELFEHYRIRPEDLVAAVKEVIAMKEVA